MHCHAVVHEGADSEGAVRADGSVVGFKGAVFEGVALDDGSCVEGAFVTDGDEAFFGYAAAVVEDLVTDPNA